MTARVLLVEDENIVAMELQAVLEDLGYTIAALASSGEGAVTKAAETRPDLALVDIRIKGNLDGIEAAQEIGARFDVPIIYLTAYADRTTVERAKITEPFGYLLKPYEQRELHITIEMALYKHKMEKELKEKERWLAATLRSIGDGVVATDHEGRIIFVNPIAAAMLGQGQADVLGQDLSEALTIIDERTHAAIDNPIQQVLADGADVFQQDIALLSGADAGEIPIEYTASPLNDDRGRIRGVVLVLRNVTERKEMEQKLLHSERLAAMGHLAAALTHEINNPLQSIATSVELAQRFPTTEARQQRYLDVARREVDRLITLSRRWLDFARPPTLERCTVHVPEVAHYTLTLARKQLEQSNVRVRLEFPQDIPPVLASYDQLAQVFLNLVINAVEAMPDGGELTISAQRVEDRLEVAIADSGPGLPSQALDKLFEAFHTTKTKGLGLGLAISHSIVEQHGGTITVANAPGGGAVFTVTLPSAATTHHVS
jgi:PAS domain S-box-containing protein